MSRTKVKAAAAATLVVGLASGSAWASVLALQAEGKPGSVVAWVAKQNVTRLNIIPIPSDEPAHPLVRADEGDSEDLYQDVMISVQESQPGSLLFYVGVNTDPGTIPKSIPLSGVGSAPCGQVAFGDPNDARRMLHAGFFGQQLSQFIMYPQSGPDHAGAEAGRPGR